MERDCLRSLTFQGMALLNEEAPLLRHKHTFSLCLCHSLNKNLNKEEEEEADSAEKAAMV